MVDPVKGNSKSNFFISSSVHEENSNSDRPSTMDNLANRVDHLSQSMFQNNRGEEVLSDSVMLVRDRREDGHRFCPEDYLAQGKAPLWLSAQMGGQGTGRSVTMTKVGKEGRKESDVERQQEFDHVFATMKKTLKLTKEDVVNYDITGHTIEIYNRAGRFIGKYDLKDREGIKKLMQARGMQEVEISDDESKTIASKIKELNSQMRVLIEPETGGKFAYVFEEDNQGNIGGVAPFNTTLSKGMEILYSDRQCGFIESHMNEIGLVKSPRKNVTTLTSSGVKAMGDIDKAYRLQGIVIKKIQQNIKKLEDKIKDKRPPHPAIPEEAVQKEIEKWEQTIRELEGIGSEISGLTIDCFRQLSKLQEEYKQLQDGVNVRTKQVKERLSEIRKTIGKLWNEGHRTMDGVQRTPLHLLLMTLNRDIAIKHPSIDEEGNTIEREIKQAGKEFLEEIKEEKYRNFGIKEEEGNNKKASFVRNQLINNVATTVADDFKKMAINQPQSKKNNLQDVATQQQEIDRLATNMGALVHDIVKREDAHFEKVKFIEGRGESTFARESRGLAFLIRAVISSEEMGIGGYQREKKSVRKLIKESVEEFQQQREGGKGFDENHTLDGVKNYFLHQVPSFLFED